MYFEKSEHLILLCKNNLTHTVDNGCQGNYWTVHFIDLKEVGHTFVVMVCILPIFNSLWHFGIVIFDA